MCISEVVKNKVLCFCKVQSSQRPCLYEEERRQEPITLQHAGDEALKMLLWIEMKLDRIQTRLSKHISHRFIEFKGHLVSGVCHVTS